MLTTRDHGVDDYTVLRDMDGTDVGVLREDDQACLDELGKYLVTTDAWQRFAIWLLHKHFEPGAGEVFVERAIHAPRGTETAPVERSAFPGQALNMTAIRFDDSVGRGVGVVGMEFAAPVDFGDTAPLSDDDEAVLAGIAERLRSHGKIDRFGVQLIRDPLSLEENELLLETTDSGSRTMNCTVGDRNATLVDGTTIQTAWRWKVVGGGTEPTVMRECTAGCQPVGEGHDIAHSHSPEGQEFADRNQPIVMRECTAGCRSVGEGHDLAHSHSSEGEEYGND
jgi:hypothetical protein